MTKVPLGPGCHPLPWDSYSSPRTDCHAHYTVLSLPAAVTCPASAYWLRLPGITWHQSLPEPHDLFQFCWVSGTGSHDQMPDIVSPQ
jgi:hypothetical protein